MKTAFVFSGQGSQSIGMGLSLYNNFRAARDVFEEVDDTLHEKLSDLMFRGDMARLTQTQNAQPAIMSVGMAVVRVLEKELGYSLTNKATFMAGHSLGEYTALCAAGALSLSDTAKVLQIRGLAMAWGSAIIYGGMMAVLGLSKEQIEEIIGRVSTREEAVYIANDNCLGQIIVSGDIRALSRMKVEAEKMGVKKIIPLAVDGAFHSPYMQPAADELLEIIQKTTVMTPKVPVVANVTALPETDPEKIKKNMIAQVTGSVRWRESVDFMKAQGIDTFIECANGKVMAGLIRRIAPEAQMLSAGDAESVQNVLTILGKSAK
jgi:[acyl-carrier-protein] S-malonyltransferase